MLSCLTKEFSHDDRNNDSCRHGLQEHLMQSDVLVKYLSQAPISHRYSASNQ